MRFIVLVFILAAFSSCEKECPVCEKECETDLNKGLLAYYTFTGNFNDESGNNLHGVATNGASLGSGVLGRPSTAASFDGFDDHIMVQDNGKLSSDSVTVSLWVTFKSVNRRHSIITRANFENTAGVSWGLGQSQDGPSMWDWGVAKSTDDCAKLHIYDPTIYSTTQQVVNPGQWYHVLTSFTNGVQKTYIDGKLMNTMNRDFKTLKKCTQAQLIIGGWWKGEVMSIDGKIDEVRIYNRGMSDCEIAKLAEVANFQ